MLIDAILLPKVYSLISSNIDCLFVRVTTSDHPMLIDILEQKLVYNLKYQTNDLLLFSDFLYNHFSYNVILIGVILLTALLGSIFLVFLALQANQKS